MIFILLFLAIGGMTTAITVGSHDKQAFVDAPHTWQGEMVCPKGQDDCNEKEHNK